MSCCEWHSRSEGGTTVKVEGDDKRVRTEGGIVIGNVVDKSKPPGRIAQRLVQGFDACLLRVARAANPGSIHEVGCGEGRITRMLAQEFTCPILGTDFSRTLIAENNAGSDGRVRYEQCGIHELDPARHAADLVVCCEVLEHVPDPERALRALARLDASTYILSVPREPVWRLLNMVRFSYVKEWGNTPGHINHWSPRTFRAMLERSGFTAAEWPDPFPWIMVTASVGR